MMRKGRKNKNNKSSPVPYVHLAISKGSRPILIFPTMCNQITRTSFVPQDHFLPFAHVHLSQSVCIFLSPSLEDYFANDLFDESQ
jgi:hypothetical protein